MDGGRAPCRKSPARNQRRRDRPGTSHLQHKTEDVIYSGIGSGSDSGHSVVVVVLVVVFDSLIALSPDNHNNYLRTE